MSFDIICFHLVLTDLQTVPFCGAYAPAVHLCPPVFLAGKVQAKLRDLPSAWDFHKDLKPASQQEKVSQALLYALRYIYMYEHVCVMSHCFQQDSTWLQQGWCCLGLHGHCSWELTFGPPYFMHWKCGVCLKACGVNRIWTKAPQSLPSLLINPSLFISNCVDHILQKQKGCIPLPQIIHTCSQPIYLITEDADPAEQLQPSVKDPSWIQGLQTQWKSLS